MVLGGRVYCRAGHRPLRTSFSSHSPLSLSVLLSAPFYFNLPAKGGTWVWFWRALRQKGPLIAWELHFLPRFPSPYAPSNTGTSSGPLPSHLPISSLPPSHGHLPTVCHLPPVFIPPSGRRALGRPGKGELWGGSSHHHVVDGDPAVRREVLQHGDQELQTAIPVAQQQHHPDEVENANHGTGQVIGHVKDLRVRGGAVVGGNCSLPGRVQAWPCRCSLQISLWP